MEEFVEKDSFEFGNNLNNAEGNFEYNNISGLGESNYENEDLFTSNNNETVEKTEEIPDFNFEIPVENTDFNQIFDYASETQQNDLTEETMVEPNINEDKEEVIQQPINAYEETNEVEDNQDSFEPISTFEESTEPISVYEEINEVEDNQDSFEPISTFEESTEPISVYEEINEGEDDQDSFEPISTFEESTEPISVYEETNEVEDGQDSFEPISTFEESTEPISVYEETNEVEDDQDSFEPINVYEETEFNNSNFTFDASEEINNIDNQINQNFEVDGIQNVITTEKIDNEFLETKPETFSNSMVDDFEYDIVAPTIEPVLEKKEVEQTNIISDTPIDELNKLTEYKEEKISTTDIKSLFNRIGANVQEASDIFVKNTEMKERIDAKFEELKLLQLTIENAKKTQYDEINAYKEEVFGKLTEKKNEIEERINKLKEFQDNLEKEKEEFEKYKNEQTAEIERVQKEVQDAYESRREELNHIEDVLRKQKDSLDEERNQLSLDKIQYEADKNELANNLLKFNQIVDSFTIGMESAGKGE